jgi:hypothetical protein
VAAAGLTARPRPVRWRFRARDAGRAVDNSDVAAWGAGGFAGSLDRLPARGPGGGAGGDARARGGARRRLGLRLRAAGARRRWEAPAEELAGLPACAFGAIAVARTTTAAHELVLADLARARAPRRGLCAVGGGAEAGLERALGRFPVEELLVTVMPRARAGVGHGRTRGFGRRAVVIEVNARATAGGAGARTGCCWHEFVHLALPSLAPEHAWLEEGSATYPRAAAARARRPAHRGGGLGRAARRVPPRSARARRPRARPRLELGGTYYGGRCSAWRPTSRSARARGTAARCSTRSEAWSRRRQRHPQLAHRARDRGGRRGHRRPVLRELYAERRGRPGPARARSLWRSLGVAVVEAAWSSTTTRRWPTCAGP